MVHLHPSCKTAERVSVGHCETVVFVGRDDGAALQALAGGRQAANPMHRALHYTKSNLPVDALGEKGFESSRP